MNNKKKKLKSDAVIFKEIYTNETIGGMCELTVLGTS